MDMRSSNDWAALKKAEREGREPPGTFARLLQEEQEAIAAANGCSKPPVMNLNTPSVPPSPSLRDFDVVIEQLVPLLSEPGAKKRLTELRSAIAEHKAASEKAAADRRDTDAYMAKREADFQAQVHDKTRAMDEREQLHNEAVASFHAEQAAERKRLDEVLGAALGKRSEHAPLARHMETVNEALK
jgi:hypothetical protein